MKDEANERHGFRIAEVVRRPSPIVRLLAFPLLLGGLAMTAAAQNRLTYPPARKGDIVDDYHGVKIADPYRWLEDSDSPETREWIEAENRLTLGWLASIPDRDR